MGPFGVEGVDFVELGCGQERKLVFEEGFGFVGGIKGFVGEDSSFVGIIAIDGRNLYEFALVKEGVCGVDNEVVIKDRPVREKWLARCSGKGFVRVLLLQKGRVKTTKTS